VKNSFVAGDAFLIHTHLQQSQCQKHEIYFESRRWGVFLFSRQWFIFIYAPMKSTRRHLTSFDLKIYWLSLSVDFMPQMIFFSSLYSASMDEFVFMKWKWTSSCHNAQQDVFRTQTESKWRFPTQESFHLGMRRNSHSLNSHSDRTSLNSIWKFFSDAFCWINELTKTTIEDNVRKIEKLFFFRAISKNILKR
jgi:hypothetical protein